METAQIKQVRVKIQVEKSIKAQAHLDEFEAGARERLLGALGAGQHRFAQIALRLLAVAALSCSSGGGGGGPTGALVSVAVVPSTVSLPLGRSVQLAAVAALDDGTRFVVTTDVSWTSSLSATVASVAAGVVTPTLGNVGDSTTITATYKGKAGNATVTLAGATAAIGPGHDTDPLIAQQWHLQNTGQNGYAAYSGVAGYDINAAATYAAGFAGRGVKVAVVDTGLEIAHEDLAANVAPGSWNFTTRSFDPTTTATKGDHGTSVGGLIAAVHANGVGGMGVAPGAKLNGYNLIGQVANGAIANYVASLGAGSGGSGPTSNDVWVFNQSFGTPNSVPILVNGMVEAQYWYGVRNLRGGLGAIYVKSAGNGFGGFGFANCSSANTAGVSCQNASMDPDNTLPPNIVVGALNASGRRSSYSTAGAAVWIASFGGEYGYDSSNSDCGASCADTTCYHPAMVTVDQSGCTVGTSVSRTVNNVLSAFAAGEVPANSTCNYTNTFNGTSSAAPVASGVIALMLEANPALTWRDVKHILAWTGQPVDLTVVPKTKVLSNGTYVLEPGWSQNAAGYWFHNWYGFGMIDADFAVSVAKSYGPGRLGTLNDTGWTPDAAGGAIPDNSVTGASSSISISNDLVVEAVQVQVAWDHTRPGDLGVELTSPSGRTSVVLNAMNGWDPNPNAATPVVQLATNYFYSERSAGTWSLKVVDANPGNTGSLLGWRLRIYGH